MSDRLTLNLGLRYDLVTGVQIDQSRNPNFQALQAAGRAGRFNGVIGFEDFGKDPRDDRDNIQPRLGFAYDVRGTGTDVVRGGWGVYQDFGYTNSNVLFAAIDAGGLGHGAIFSVNDTQGIKKTDGTAFRVGDPISTIAKENEADPANKLFGQVVSPRLRQPYTRQANIGWAHQLSNSTALTADVVHIDGRDLNVRFRPNYRTLADGAASPGRPRPPSQFAGDPPGHQRRREPVRCAHPGNPPAHDRRTRLQRVVYARAARRATSARPPTNWTPTTCRR